MTDWYENRHKLRSEMIFKDIYGEKVKLCRRVPGNGTKWYVAISYDNNTWMYDYHTVEPSDLVEYICG